MPEPMVALWHGVPLLVSYPSTCSIVGFLPSLGMWALAGVGDLLSNAIN